MRTLTALFWRCYENSILRYVFFGGLTTLVNLVSFFLLRQVMGLPLQVANVSSIILAILFAYVVNSKFVFQDNCHGIKEHFQPFVRFLSARGVTMVVEILGVWLLVEKMALYDMLGKFLTQFLVLVLNYIFSRFFVFQKREK